MSRTDWSLEAGKLEQLETKDWNSEKRSAEKRERAKEKVGSGLVVA